MRETGRIDEGVGDHRPLEIADITLVVLFFDSRNIGFPAKGVDILKEYVLDGVVYRRRSEIAAAADVVARSEESREAVPQGRPAGFT